MGLSEKNPKHFDSCKILKHHLERRSTSTGTSLPIQTFKRKEKKKDREHLSKYCAS